MHGFHFHHASWKGTSVFVLFPAFFNLPEFASWYHNNHILFSLLNKEQDLFSMVYIPKTKNKQYISEANSNNRWHWSFMSRRLTGFALILPNGSTG
jgi:hypothetical protein